MNTNERVTIDEILNEVLRQEPAPDYEALLRWTNKYPEHREALADFFAAWAVGKEGSDRPAVDEDNLASIMVSHALNLIYQQKSAEAAQGESTSVRLLCKMIDSSGCTPDRLLSECQLDDSMLAKLDRHLIVFATIPRMCIQKLAQTLKTTFAEMSRILNGPPILLPSHKAKGKLATTQQTFLDAVASSQLPDDLKKQWQQVTSIESSQ